MHELLLLDGALGEGGGQMLRSALGLSVATGHPFEMVRIRAGRQRPGLLRQHLAGVRLLAALGKAEVQGAEIGSTELRFCPTARASGDYEVAVGSAGSALLVLQAALPALLSAEGPVRLAIEGGTHNSGAPPFEHTEQVLGPALGRMGAQLSLTLERHGFYPAGGGRVVVQAQPAPLTPLSWLERGAIEALTARALVAAVPTRVGLRELRHVRQRLAARWPMTDAEAQQHLRVQEVERPVGPGNAALVFVRSRHGAEVFTGFGERGRPAEAVAEELALETLAWLDAGVPVAPHTADQLLVPMAMAGGGVFRTTQLTPHATSNMAIIRRFLPVDFVVAEEPDGAVRVSVA